MKRITLAIALTLAAVATAGQLRHPSNPLTLGGQQVVITRPDFPFPSCPPACRQ